MSEQQSEKTRADLGWDVLLLHLSQRCHTDRGVALSKKVAPFKTLEEAHTRQAEVGEARSLQDRGEGLSFGGVRDLLEPLQRAKKGGVLLPTELCDFLAMLRAASRLRRHLGSRMDEAPLLLAHAAQLAELPEVAGPISDAFDDGGVLKDTASPALKGLRQRVQALQAELAERGERLLDQGHIAPYLQDRFVTQREERYVVPVRADARARVKGIVHGISASGATVYIEPEEIIDLNNRLKLAQLEVADEERRILLALSTSIREAAERIEHNLEVLAVLDLIDAKARLAVDLRATPVTLLPKGEGRIDLRNARHPLLHLASVKVVPSDISVTTGGTLVISGPNAGGKTVSLKVTGLCALLARSGMHCPTQEGSQIPWFDEVLTDVGDDQSLERNLSTFSAHVLQLCRFLKDAGPSTLILLDEVAAGTDPEQGAALAQSILEHLAQRGATVIVTTHYDRLKAMAPKDPRFFNASVGYDLERLQPTYRLHLGTPGASGAVLVGRRLGLPDEVTRRAEELLGDRSTGTETLLQTLAQERERLFADRQAAEALRKAAEADAQAAEALAIEMQAALRKARKQAHDEAIHALRKARTELEQTLDAIKKSGQRAQQAVQEGKQRHEIQGEFTKVQQQIDRLSQRVAQAAPEPEVPEGRPIRGGVPALGTKVIVPRLGGIGIVVSDVDRGKVVVQVGALKLSVEVAELRVPEVSPKVSPEVSKSSSGGGGVVFREESRGGGHKFTEAPKEGGPGRVRTAGSTLDLRGERVDAALGRAEKFLDDALRSGESAVFLIHGHGTGALRQALRAHFAGYPGVTTLYPAGQSDGGDGVTIIELG